MYATFFYRKIIETISGNTVFWFSSVSWIFSVGVWRDKTNFSVEKRVALRGVVAHRSYIDVFAHANSCVPKIQKSGFQQHKVRIKSVENRIRTDEHVTAVT